MTGSPSRVRRWSAAAVTGAAAVVGAAASGALLLAAGPAAAASTVTVAYVPALVVTDASLSPAAAEATAGESLLLHNDGAAGVTVSELTGPTSWGSFAVAGGGSSPPIPLSAGDYRYQVVGPDGVVVLGGLAGDGTVAGAVHVAPAAPATTAAPPRTTAPPARSSSPPARSSTPAAGPSAAAPGAGAGPHAAATGTSASDPGSVFADLGLPGGLIPFAGLGSAAGGTAQNPLVAPYATDTAAAAPGGPGVPGGSSLPQPVGLAGPRTPAPGDRALGLPATVTAALLAGLVVTLLRILLLRPEARAGRKH